MQNKNFFYLLVATILIIMMSFTFVNAASLKFTDVSNDYWGKASIDYISSKGYMVGYGDKFGVLDNVTEGQYLAVLCRIFGYKNQSPLTVEEPTRELGLVKSNEYIRVTANLKRGDIAKYTIRAFELLNTNVKYPDYLDAYKPMIKDYEKLGGELRLIALKCVEKGLLAGGPDGNFNPNDETTRAQAAAFIHRILEQSERDKVKPVFATVDKEFEAFMNSKEAENFVSFREISRVVDGKILWKTPISDEEYLLPVYYRKNVNKIAYEAVKTFSADARKNNNYLHPRRLYLTDKPEIMLTYYSSERFCGSEYYNLRLNILPEPYRLGINSDQKLNTDFYWEIMALGSSDNYKWPNNEEIVKAKSKLDEFMTPLRNIMKTIYGETVGGYLYNYSIGEWDSNFDAVWSGSTYSNNKKVYIDKFNLEIQNYSPSGFGCPKFGTNYINKQGD